MRKCVKKIHCPNCQQLVKGREEQKEDKTSNLSCTKCGRLLYIWNGYTWMHEKA